jgi:hypothetical protein
MLVLVLPAVNVRISYTLDNARQFAWRRAPPQLTNNA